MCTNEMDIHCLILKSFTKFCYEYLIILKEIHRLYEFPYAVIMFYYSISSQIVHYIHNDVVNLKQPAIIFLHVLCMQSDYPPPPPPSSSYTMFYSEAKGQTVILRLNKQKVT